MPYLTRQQVLARLKAEIDKAGSASALARKLDVTPTYISAVMAGKMPGPKIKKLIGVERVEDLWVAVGQERS